MSPKHFIDERLEGLCQKHGILQEELCDTRQKSKNLVLVRQAVALELYDVWGFSYNEVAAILCCQHSSVIHMVRRAREQRDKGTENGAH